MHKSLLTDPGSDVLSEALRALADPSRRTQLMRLAQGPATSGQLADLLTMSRPAGSQHLAVLVTAGLVESTQQGRHRWQRIRLDHLHEARDWLTELLALADATSAAQAPITGQPSTLR